MPSCAHSMRILRALSLRPNRHARADLSQAEIDEPKFQIRLLSPGKKRPSTQWLPDRTDYPVPWKDLAKKRKRCCPRVLQSKIQSVAEEGSRERMRSPEAKG